MRTVEDLPFVPTTWIDVEAALRRAQRRHQPVHAVEAEAHPEQLEGAQVAPRPAPASRARRVTAPPARRAARASLARSASTTCAGARCDEAARWRACPRRARSRPRARARRSARRRSACSGSKPPPASTCDASRRGPGRVATGSPSSRPRRRSARAARPARRSRRSRRPPAAPGTVAPAATPTVSRQLRSAVHGVDQRAAPPPRRAGSRSESSGSAKRRAGEQALGARAGSDQISSVTNGITGCASASVSRST